MINKLSDHNLKAQISQNLNNVSYDSLLEMSKLILKAEVKAKYNINLGNDMCPSYVKFSFKPEISLEDNFKMFETAIKEQYETVEKYHLMINAYLCFDRSYLEDMKAKSNGTHTLIFNCSYYSSEVYQVANILNLATHMLNGTVSDYKGDNDERLPSDQVFDVDLSNNLEGLKAKKYKNGKVHISGVSHKLLKEVQRLEMYCNKVKQNNRK